MYSASLVTPSKHIGGWIFDTVALDGFVAASDREARFFALWRGKFRADGSPPLWSDLDIMDLLEWWGWLSLFRFEPEIERFRTRLWGTDLTALFGLDYTNQLLGDQGIMDEAWLEQEHAYFTGLWAERRVGLAAGDLALWDKSFASVRAIDLPVSGRNGGFDILTLYQRTDRDAGDRQQ